MERGATIAGGIVLPWGETPIPSARRFGFLGVDPVEIGENGGDRTSQAVDVEATELGTRPCRQVLIVSPQPFYEIMYVNIAPHPGRKARKGFLGRRFVRVVVHVAVDACGVGPIRLDGADIKPMLFNQVARDRCAGFVKFRRAMARLTEKDEFRVRKAVEKCAELIDFLKRGEGFAKGANNDGHLIGAFGANGLR